MQKLFDAFARGAIEAMVECATPDCVFYPDPNWMEHREYRGRDGVIAFHKTQTEAFGDDFTRGAGGVTLPALSLAHLARLCFGA